MFPSSAPPTGWAEFSCPWVVNLGPQIIDFYVFRERILGIINLLSSLGRMWVSCTHCFIVLGACLMLLLPGFVAKHSSLVLWLSKPGFFSNH